MQVDSISYANQIEKVQVHRLKEQRYYEKVLHNRKQAEKIKQEQIAQARRQHLDKGKYVDIYC